MPRQPQNYYPLIALMEKERREFPLGRTFAVKRVSPSDVKIPSRNEVIKLGLVNAPPEEYIIDTSTLASGLHAVSINVAILASSEKDVNRRRTSGISLPVAAVSFIGSVLMPDHDDILTVGAYVPGERATGFIHLAEPERAADIFKR